jgi:phosphatidylglycerophosphate synthase
MRKISESLENPFDNIIIELADQTDSLYKSANLTPNNLTTISLFFGLLTAYYLYKGYNKLATITFLISYYYDCMDGNYARKYDMVTDFGDFYDHFCDFLKVALILFAMFKKNPNKFKFVFLILVFFYTLSSVHIGCQEKASHVKHNQPILEYTQSLCPNSDWITYTRWFGSGTAVLVNAFLIYTF